MLIILLSFLFSFSNSLDSTIEPLAVSNISPNLLIDASAVVRYEHINSHIKSISSIEIKVNKAVTVLSNEGARAGHASIYYNDEEDKIKNFKIEIYDANGDIVSKIKKKEIQDQSVYDGFSMANDSRVTFYHHISNSYPYTVVYSYTKTSKNTLNTPYWLPLNGTGLSLEKSTYTLTSDVAGMKFRRKSYNCEQYDIKLEEENTKFEATNIRAQKLEPMLPNFHEYLPFVRIKPSTFTFFGFEGSYDDWDSYGSWMYDNMLTGRGTLPKELITEIEELLPTEATNEEKARIIYDYVTNSTRYVSVQLGVGGFMPFTCSDVFGLKYGDCKALSFYTQNILMHFGVDAIYTEIKSDRNHNYSYDEDFPGLGQGNHIILCLPNEGDTLWLECTSSNILFGYVHSGINNRKALLIKSSDSQLVRTGSYRAEDNLSKCNFELSILESDELSIKFDNKHHNLKYENMIPLVLANKDKRDKRVTDYYNQLRGLTINDFEINLDSIKIVANEKGDFVSSLYIEKAGNYKMIPINVSNFDMPDKIDVSRSHPIYIKDGSTDRIRISLNIPEGMVCVKSKNPLIEFENEYGIATSKITYHEIERKVIYEISIQQNAGTFKAESAEVYNEYINAIRSITEQKIILKPID